MSTRKKTYTRTEAQAELRSMDRQVLDGSDFFAQVADMLESRPTPPIPHKWTADDAKQLINSFNFKSPSSAELQRLADAINEKNGR